MKHKLLTGIAAVAAIILVYSSCKKDAVQTTKNTVDSKVVTQQLALNLSETLYGGLGGFDLSNGLHPQIYAVQPNHKKIVINSVNADCGLKLDTTLSYDFSSDTTKLKVSGHFKISSVCTGDNVSGLTVFDSLLVTATTPSLSINYKIGQNLTITALTPQNPESQLSMSGSMNQAADLQYNKGTKAKASTFFKYVLSAVLIDPANDGDIKGGTATFHTTGDTPQGKWDYSGTIVFLGDHKVKITINGTVYTVDIQTGQIV